jgi:hypothetical protein
MNVDSIEESTWCALIPAAREQIHPVTTSRNSSEDFVEVYLRASGIRIFPVVPVDDEDAH